MDAEDKLLEVSESDRSFEEFYRELFNPFIEGVVWEFEEDYDIFIEFLGELNRSKFEDKEMRNEDERPYNLQSVGGNPTTFHHGNADLKLQRTDSGDMILSGWLEYSPEDIDTRKEVESGSLLTELRNTYRQIIENHKTCYIQTEDDQSIGHVEASDESILGVAIPTDYDPETYQETVNSLTSIAVEIENLHRSIEALVSGYADSR